MLVLTLYLDHDNSYPEGNGTQSIVWQINEETYRVKLEESHGAPPQKPGLQVFYGSLHDILSYPCEVRSCLVSCRSMIFICPEGRQSRPCPGCVSLNTWPARSVHREHPPRAVHLGDPVLRRALRQEILQAPHESERLHRCHRRP